MSVAGWGSPWEGFYSALLRAMCWMPKPGRNASLSSASLLPSVKYSYEVPELFSPHTAVELSPQWPTQTSNPYEVHCCSFRFVHSIRCDDTRGRCDESETVERSLPATCIISMYDYYLVSPSTRPATSFGLLPLSPRGIMPSPVEHFELWINVPARYATTDEAL